MLSKCANPNCNAIFRRMGQGRLFEAHFEEAEKRRRSGTANAPQMLRKEPKSIEHFWLCDECAQKMTIGLNSHTNCVMLIPSLYKNNAPVILMDAGQDEAQSQAG